MVLCNSNCLIYVKVFSNDVEFEIEKTNKMVVRNDLEQELMEDSQEIEFTKTYRNKNVTIHLEFSVESNEKATNDFFSRLKELYLKKMEIKFMQLRESALQCVNMKGKENGKDV